MTEQIKTFEQVLDKYKLKTPINQDIQGFILESRKKNLNLVLKRVGQFGLLYWMVIVINFTFKKFGINLSILQSKIIFGITTVVITTTSSTGVYYTGKYVYKKYISQKMEQLHQIPKLEKLEPLEIEVPELKETDEKNKINNRKKAIKEIKTYKFGIQQFKSDTTGSDKIITQKIYDEIKNLEGYKSITWSQKNKKVKLMNMITGSYRKIGDSYQLTAKVIDSETLKVKLLLSETISNKDEIDNACKKIAREITKKIK